jgi:hypothetical protein
MTPAPSNVLWIGPYGPTHEEEKAVEVLLRLQFAARGSH